MHVPDSLIVNTIISRIPTRLLSLAIPLLPEIPLNMAGRERGKKSFQISLKLISKWIFYTVCSKKHSWLKQSLINNGEKSFTVWPLSETTVLFRVGRHLLHLFQWKPLGNILQFGTAVVCYNVKYEEHNTAGCPGTGKGNATDCPSFC